MRFRRSSAPGDTLEFDIAVPEGLTATRGFGGYDLTISTGDPQDPRATTISVGALREADGPVTLDEHVASVRARLAQAQHSRHVVDERPTELAGLPAWWSLESGLDGAQAFVVERWLLVRDGVAWTVNVQLPWMSFNLRDGALAVVGTLRFRDAEEAR